MAKTSSTMLALGTVAPDFRLPDAVGGKTLSFGDCAGKKGCLVMFLCVHCPYVKHVQAGLAQLAEDYEGKGVGIVAVNPNDVAAYPEDSPENMRALAREQGFSFPFCCDETQETAKAYAAACTPDFFLFDGERRLVYRGQLDDSRPGSAVPVTGRDLRAALDALLAGRPVPREQKPSVGCSIKWK
jgi:peroxiredoxin